MNLQRLQKVQNDKFYFEIALRQAQKDLQKKFGRLPKDDVKRQKSIEIEKIKYFTRIITSNLNIIIESFPRERDLNEFYKELIDNNIGIGKMKKELSKVKVAMKFIGGLHSKSIMNIRLAKDKNRILKEKSSFFGRVGSIMKNIRTDLEMLEKMRRELKELPTIKTDIRTICIAGYPNVGKSTLLKKITTANPEVNIYPFTTKSLMMGYIGKELQIIDTPGTFRNKEEMNKIEKQAYLAIKHLAEIIVFVIDFTESCGYEIGLQKEMLETVKRDFKDKKIIIYASKGDMLTEEQIKKYSEEDISLEEEDIFFDSEKLKKFLLEN